MRNEWLEKIAEAKKGKDYDVAVMYSGGKDSSYLLYLLKEVYKLRVLAVFVDNGFERENICELIKEFPNRMGVDFVVVTPERNHFCKLFHTLVTESELFMREKVNHVCFICNNILWCSVARYAAANDIPYVASGLSLAQLSSGRPYPLEPDRMANSIAERSTKQVLKNAMAGFYKTKAYENDAAFRGFIDGLSSSVSKVTTIYPFIYHQVSVEELKETVYERGWCPPNGKNREEYISSGCQIMSGVIGELEKLGIVTLNEREQAKAMMEAGLLDERSMGYATYDASKDVVNVSKPIIDTIGIKEYLIGKCKEQGRTYL